MNYEEQEKRGVPWSRHMMMMILQSTKMEEECLLKAEKWKTMSRDANKMKKNWKEVENMKNRPQKHVILKTVQTQIRLSGLRLAWANLRPQGVVFLNYIRSSEEKFAWANLNFFFFKFFLI